MRSRLLFFALFLVLAVAGGTWLNQPSQAASSSFGEAKVRLFSNGQVVGQWTAVGPGRVEGSTFVFPIRKGARDFDVRISGTFSFEPEP